MIPVVVRAPGYAAAVAELAPTVVRTDAVPGAVVVLAGGQRWWAEARAAAEAGAAAIVVADPKGAPPEGDAVDPPIPVVIARRRLRADHVADARRARSPRLVLADADGPASGITTWLPDVLGWCRVIADGPLDIVHAARTPGAIIAAATSVHGVPVSVALTLHAPGSPTACSVLGVAEGRTDVRWDEAAGSFENTHVDAHGRRIAPERFESAERLALRRAVDAVTAGADLGDVADLRLDARAAASLVRAAAS